MHWLLPKCLNGIELRPFRTIFFDSENFPHLKWLLREQERFSIIGAKSYDLENSLEFPNYYGLGPRCSWKCFFLFCHFEKEEVVIWKNNRNTIICKMLLPICKLSYLASFLLKTTNKKAEKRSSKTATFSRAPWGAIEVWR